MDDIEWATTLADKDTAPDEFLDALKHARDLGRQGFADEVVGTSTNLLLDSKAMTPLVNALILGSQAFDCNMGMQLANGPVTITFQVKSDASAE